MGHASITYLQRAAAPCLRARQRRDGSRPRDAVACLRTSMTTGPRPTPIHSVSSCGRPRTKFGWLHGNVREQHTCRTTKRPCRGFQAREISPHEAYSLPLSRMEGNNRRETPLLNSETSCGKDKAIIFAHFSAVDKMTSGNPLFLSFCPKEPSLLTRDWDPVVSCLAGPYLYGPIRTRHLFNAQKEHGSGPTCCRCR